MTLGEIRKELNVYNKTINNYNKTFELNLNIPAFIKGPRNYEIRDYQEIDDKLVVILKSHKDLKDRQPLSWHKYLTQINQVKTENISHSPNNCLTYVFCFYLIYLG